LKRDCDAFHYWSLHVGGGGLRRRLVHFLSYSAASVLAALSTRAGGETVGAFE